MFHAVTYRRMLLTFVDFTFPTNHRTLALTQPLAFSGLSSSSQVCHPPSGATRTDGRNMFYVGGTQKLTHFIQDFVLFDRILHPLPRMHIPDSQVWRPACYQPAQPNSTGHVRAVFHDCRLCRRRHRHFLLEGSSLLYWRLGWLRAGVVDPMLPGRRPHQAHRL